MASIKKNSRWGIGVKDFCILSSTPNNIGWDIIIEDYMFERLYNIYGINAKKQRMEYCCKGLDFSSFLASTPNNSGLDIIIKDYMFERLYNIWPQCQKTADGVII